ncbi:ADP-ribosylglycohydrolase family protein [Sphingobium tyrosinilyticum]|uniref:protein-tyrosine-phosphatase n=1 Tax=Sphingobium tyrosinilyticum TaxID=2715436 RepID=A0ABV9EY67_9SPHN
MHISLLRTSLDCPLTIAEMKAGHGYGLVGVTFCPGKKQPSAWSDSWERDLDLDLDAIVSWGAAAVVTLIEPHELQMLKVERLAEAVRQRAMLWYHLPIADVSVPGPEFERAWQSAGASLRAIIRDGGNVLVHCKGGLGRAGTIAARLLVELGQSPAYAIARVREARPGAIESDAQLQHVRRLRPISEPEPYTDRVSVEQRAVGAMLGLAVGDAVGTTLEFTARDSGPPLTDMIGGGPFGLEAGQWTDDTAMALALMASLTEHDEFEEADLMRRFVDWQRNGAYSCTGTCFDIGNTTLDALLRWQASGDPIAGSTDPSAAGNGSLMRLAPVAVRYWNDPTRLDEVAARQSRTTHSTIEAVDACRAYAQLLAEAIQGKPRRAMLGPRKFIGAPGVETIMGGSWRGKQRREIRASGYVLHSLEAALWCVGRTGSLEEAVLLAANLGEDADTTAAITGQLAGAIYGVDAIPTRWRERLAWGRKIEEAARALHRASL